MAGGWAQAARLPLEESLAWAEERMRRAEWKAHGQAMQIWASALPAYAWGGEPPSPPEPPED